MPNLKINAASSQSVASLRLHMFAQATRHLMSGRWLVAAVFATMLAGCATTVVNEPRNQPLANKRFNAEVLRAAPAVGGETLVALSFSGGGLRAAAFAYGALEGLRETATRTGSPLLDDLTFITSVSGGSITAAYAGLHGVRGLANFREHALLRDGEAGLRFSLLNPVNLSRLAAGGLNDRANFQQWLEEDLFKRATFADMYRNKKTGRVD